MKKPSAQTKIPDGFVHIKKGTFIMGSPPDEAERYDGEVQHRVTVSSFYMSKYLVTQKEYEELMGKIPRSQALFNISSLSKIEVEMGKSPGSFKGDNLPVECVTWYDAIEYCNKRSIKEGLAPAYTIYKELRDPYNMSPDDAVKWTVLWNKKANGYRLPTEAEWEYACRVGTTTPFNTGNNITTDQANYNGNYPYNNNAKGIYRQETTPVGSFAPNAWGLYDMHGNVNEWVYDWYGDYSKKSQTNPVGVFPRFGRMIRGGSWRTYGLGLRSACRLFLSPADRNNSVGFRLVRSEFPR